MSQHDYVLDNQAGAQFRSDLNNALAAIATANSGATAPTTTYANQLWYDTTLGILNIRNAANSAWLSFQPLIPATAQTTTSGINIDFTGIPSGTRRITILLADVSTNGTSNMLIQLGDSGGIETTGYVSACNQFNGSPSASSSTAGFIIQEAMSAPANASGQVVISNVSGNLWVASSCLVDSQPSNAIGAGSKTLSSVLDRVRITTVNGTDTFDAGTINILYE
jgi:hypothetical protein